MYIFDGLTASAAMRTQAEIDSVIRQLAKNDAYQPVLRSAGRELLRLTGSKLRASQESNLLLAVLGGPRATHSPDTPMLGELFFLDGSAMIVQPMRSRLAIGEVLATKRIQSFLNLPRSWEGRLRLPWMGDVSVGCPSSGCH